MPKKQGKKEGFELQSIRPMTESGRNTSMFIAGLFKTGKEKTLKDLRKEIRDEQARAGLIALGASETYRDEPTTDREELIIEMSKVFAGCIAGIEDARTRMANLQIDIEIEKAETRAILERLQMT